MERTFVYPITEQENKMPIGRYLRSMGFSAQALIALKKMPGSILLNGRWEYVHKEMSAGDVLTIHLLEKESSPHIPPIPLPLDILYEDEDLLVVNKPADMPIHPSMNNHDNTLANAVAYYFQSRNIPYVFRCVNRLDRDTTGLTVLAKHMVSAGILSEMVQNRTLHREYQAIVSGTDLPDFGTIDAPIARVEGSTIERKVDFEKGEHAVTHYRVLQRDTAKNLSLLSLSLETGRTHQIRVHMKYLGYPLIGDFIYHPDKTYIARQALHSCRLSFPHPITKEAMDFHAPLPEDMRILQ